LITGKLGKTSSGLISLKEKNNSQGLFDMGISPELGVGGVAINNPELTEKMKKSWNVNAVPQVINDNLFNSLKSKEIKNVFIYGEDPIGCAKEKKSAEELLNGKNFIMVQDYFMTDTAKKADLILPSSLPFESGGSYSNTQKFLVNFDAVIESKIEKKNYEQLIDVMRLLGVKCKLDITHNITLEIASLLSQKEKEEDEKLYKLNYTENDDMNRIFDYGCDNLLKRFEDSFNKAFEN
jgi:formate dehydrogenase major subunit